uniref:Uncharacterized protein n=1 Tax=Lygus hesperus TaxID=30085 RepID=A0A146LQN2_LYGHE
MPESMTLIYCAVKFDTSLRNSTESSNTTQISHWNKLKIPLDGFDMSSFRLVFLVPARNHQNAGKDEESSNPPCRRCGFRENNNTKQRRSTVYRRSSQESRNKG